MTSRVETSGRTVEEAIDAALEILGAREDEVEIRILSEGDEDALTRSDARVLVAFRDERTEEDHRLDQESAAAQRLRDRQIPSDVARQQADAIKGFLEGLFEVMRLPATVYVESTQTGALAEISGEDLALLIGRHGATVGSLQELSRAVANKQTGVRSTISVDVEGYYERRTQMLERMAHTSSARARKTRREVALEPMPARDRKIVHDALMGTPGIRTESEGEEPYRRVVVVPT